jgi:hypothetical protein
MGTADNGATRSGLHETQIADRKLKHKLRHLGALRAGPAIELSPRGLRDRLRISELGRKSAQLLRGAQTIWSYSS